MTIGIEGRIEARMGVAQLGRTAGDVMQDRRHAGCGNIRILRAVPGGAEERIGIAAFGSAVVDVVGQRIDTGAPHVRIFVQIPVAIDQRGKIVGGRQRRVRARKAAIRGGHAASFRDLSVGYAF
jgi:hypothetical protein